MSSNKSMYKCLMKKTTNLHVSISVSLYSLSLIRSLLLVSSVLLSLTQPALLRTLNSSHVAARPDRVKNGNTEING